MTMKPYDLAAGAGDQRDAGHLAGLGGIGLVPMLLLPATATASRSGVSR